MSEADPLRGRIAFVTGGGAGIGRAIALDLARLGAEVVVNGRRPAPLEETAALARASGGSVRALAGDLGDAGWMARFAELGRVDVLVHSAVHFPPYGELEALADSEIERVHDITVLAPMRLLARVLPGMKQRGFGRIVLIGSIAATNGAERQAAYSSAKSALHGLVRSVALECAAHGVTCNLVEPGLVLTERVLAVVPEEQRRALAAGIPMQRPGSPEEIAAVVGFLCSPRASYVTGATVPVTGGLGLGLVPPRRD